VHVSVVIPTFNRAGLLGLTIPALANQQAKNFTYEVIFVSNGSTDDSGAMLEDAVARNPGKFRYFRIAPTGGPSAPRNVGIRAATGDVVVLLDDDVVPDVDLVMRHAEFHAAHPEMHHAALGEVYVPAEMLSDPMSMFHAFPYHEVRNRERLSFVHFWTCNVSVKRQFILNAGMFDESLRWYEDVLCGHQLATNGMHLHFHFLPVARGQHLHQLKPAGVAAKGLWYGRWLYAFLERVPDPAVKERFGILSFDIGMFTLAKRLLNRAGFRVVDNLVTRACLRWLGATARQRSRVSDFYYFLIFRRHLLQGYYEAKRLARTPGALATHRSTTAWFDRGE
jgi:glycosyltransferase involved in cell wall biosynthesis